MSKVFMLLGFLSCTVWCMGQSVAKFQLKEGNEAYQSEDYEAALDRFNQLGTAEDASISKAAGFNKANTYFKTEDYENALAAYTKSASEATSDAQRAEALHNMGNTYFKMQKLQESLDAYKKALKLNPADEDTRYNYALVKKLLEQQQQQQQDQKDKQDQQQDENKEENENKDQQGQNQDQEQDQKQQQDQGQDQEQQDQQQQQQQEQQQEQQRQQQMKRKNAENLLDALNQQEKGVQRKVNKAKGKGKKVDIEKDW